MLHITANFIKRIISISFFCCLIIFVFLHLLVNFEGKFFLSKKLEKTFGKKVNIGSLRTTFPLGLRIKNLEAQDLFKIEEIDADGGLVDIFSNSYNLRLLKITKPVLYLERKQTQEPAEQKAPLEATQENRTEPQVDKKAEDLKEASQASSDKFPVYNFSLGKLIVSDGEINFIDRAAGTSEIVIKIKDINIRIDNLDFRGASSRPATLDLTGKIPWKEGVEDGKISIKGWINLAKKDLQLTINILDIDGIYLYPYYSQYVDLVKTRIEKAKLRFDSNITGLNNNLTAECHLELTDIVRTPRPPEEPQEKAEKVTDVVLDMFKAQDQGRIALDFTIRTKMDRPEFGMGILKTAVEDKLIKKKQAGISVVDILLLPAKIVEATVRSTTDVSKAIINNTVSLGKEFKKAVSTQPAKK